MVAGGACSIVSFLPDVVESAGGCGREWLMGRRGGGGRGWGSDGAKVQGWARETMKN